MRCSDTSEAAGKQAGVGGVGNVWVWAHARTQGRTPNRARGPHGVYHGVSMVRLARVREHRHQAWRGRSDYDSPGVHHVESSHTHSASPRPSYDALLLFTAAIENKVALTKNAAAHHTQHTPSRGPPHPSYLDDGHSDASRRGTGSPRLILTCSTVTARI